MGNLKHADTTKDPERRPSSRITIITIIAIYRRYRPRYRRWVTHKAIPAIGERAVAGVCIKCIDSFDLPAQIGDENKTARVLWICARTHRCEIKKYALWTIMSDDYCFWNLYASEASSQEFCISIRSRWYYAIVVECNRFFVLDSVPIFINQRYASQMDMQKLQLCIAKAIDTN